MMERMSRTDFLRVLAETDGAEEGPIDPASLQGDLASNTGVGEIPTLPGSQTLPNLSDQLPGLRVQSNVVRPPCAFEMQAGMRRRGAFAGLFA